MTRCDIYVIVMGKIKVKTKFIQGPVILVEGHSMLNN